MPYSTSELTTNERRILELASEGLTNAQIGARLGLDARAVGSTFEYIYRKMGIRPARQEAIWRYMQAGRYAQ